MRSSMQKPLVILLSLMILSGCSVYSAARKGGVSPGEIRKCRTLKCIRAKDLQVVSSVRDKRGQIIEIYKLRKKKGVSARAALHAILDVATLGLWEIAGTPIEGSIEEQSYFSIKIYYDKDQNIKRVITP